MIDPTGFAFFVGISWLLIITPGPDMLYVITRGVAHGRRAGMLSAVGVICGLLVHTIAAAFGLSLILRASGLAFQAVKFLGAVYLLYLGIRTWRDKSTFGPQSPTVSVSARAHVWQGMLSNVLNPKVAVFFLAFLPQFVDQGSSQVAWQMLLLGLTFAVFGLGFLLVVGCSAGAIGQWVTRRPRHARWLQRLAGGTLIGLGVRLAFIE